VPDKKILGKDSFADAFFTEYTLPSITLGQVFAKCNMGFTKKPNPVVYRQLEVRM
jgi:hypothetical protein